MCACNYIRTVGVNILVAGKVLFHKTEQKPYITPEAVIPHQWVDIIFAAYNNYKWCNENTYYHKKKKNEVTPDRIDGLYDFEKDFHFLKSVATDSQINSFNKNL